MKAVIDSDSPKNKFARRQTREDRIINGKDTSSKRQQQAGEQVRKAGIFQKIKVVNGEKKKKIEDK